MFHNPYPKPPFVTIFHLYPNTQYLKLPTYISLCRIASSKVIIKRVERNKRKFVTTVSGLEAFGLENKKVAKDLGKKFATGASVTKVPSGGEEIVVQGDVSEEIEEFLLEKYDVIPEDNIELVEDKKKKGSGAGG